MAGTEFLLLTDAPLVGTFGYVASEIAALTPKLGEKLENVEFFDWPPNLELLTELQPDLIISFYDASLDLAGVDEIAPLIIYDPSINKGDWRASTEFYAEIFQKQDAYADMVATYDARTAELQTVLGEDRGEIEVSLLLPTTDTPLIWLQDSAPGHILEDVGLGRPEFQVNPTIEASESGENWGFVNISLERLDLADGDEIFIFTWASADPDQLAEYQKLLEDFQDNPLWQALEGVRSGNVHVVGGHWVRAQTYLTANLILDDLFTYLTDVEPTIPSPAAEFVASE
jgi:iron complex transport system substrate-binding protein